MRTIKFRGRDAEYRHWTYGSLFKNEVCCRIIKETATIDEEGFLDDFSVVDPKTVGEFTGLKDNNGTEIYEGDFIKAIHRSDSEEYEGNVEFLQGCYWMVFNSRPNVISKIPFWLLTSFRIIGNIHDNPELLKT